MFQVQVSGKYIDIEITLYIFHGYTKAPVDQTELLGNYSRVSNNTRVRINGGLGIFLEVNKRGGWKFF